MARRVNVHHYVHRAQRNSASGGGWLGPLAVLFLFAALIKFWFIWIPAVLVIAFIRFLIKDQQKDDQRFAAEAARKKAHDRLVNPHDGQDDMTHDTVMHTLPPDVTETILINLKKAAKSA